MRWPDARPDGPPGGAAIPRLSRWPTHLRPRPPVRRRDVVRGAAGHRNPARGTSAAVWPLISTPEARGSTATSAIAQLAADPGPFDPEVLRALQQCYSTAEAEAPRQVTLDELRAGMVVLEEVMNARGTVLVGRGSVITARMIERLRNYAESDHDLGPIIVSSTAVA